MRVRYHNLAKTWLRQLCYEAYDICFYCLSSTVLYSLLLVLIGLYGLCGWLMAGGSSPTWPDSHWLDSEAGWGCTPVMHWALCTGETSPHHMHTQTTPCNNTSLCAVVAGAQQSPLGSAIKGNYQAILSCCLTLFWAFPSCSVILHRNTFWNFLFLECYRNSFFTFFWIHLKKKTQCNYMKAFPTHGANPDLESTKRPASDSFF